MNAFARTGTAVAGGAGALRAWWNPVATAAAGGLVLAALVPAVAPGWVHVDDLAATLYLALAAVGLRVSVGRGGLPSLAQGAFMAIGAFVAAALRSGDRAPLIVAVVAGVAAAAAGGLVTGAAVVRLRPALLAVATWVVSWLVAFALLAFPALSGGAQGRVLEPAVVLGAWLTPAIHYELALVLVALAAGSVALVGRSRFGIALAAARDDEAGATALGVDVTQTRLRAFVASAAIAGLAGALSAQLALVADPNAYGAFLSFQLLVAVLLGGAATALGPVVGVFILAGLSLAARLLLLDQADRWNPMLAALLLLTFLSVGGAGVVPWARDRVRRRRSADAPRASSAARRANAAPQPLAAHGLAKRYGALVALEDFDVELEPGTVTALIGPNGSGKSTALKLLSGAERPDAGWIALGGADVTDLGEPPRVERGIVRTQQGVPRSRRLTVLEQVLLGASVRRRFGGAVRTIARTQLARDEEAATRALARAHLEEVGLADAAERPVDELAAFDQRLVLLAAALASEPSVVLLDEPSAGAAANDLQRLADVVRGAAAAGAAVLVVEHNLRLVRLLAQRVLVLDAGALIAAGTPGEVARDARVRAAYLGTQRL